MLNRKEISEIFDIPYATLYGWKNGESGNGRQKLYYFLSFQDKKEIEKRFQSNEKKVSAYRVSHLFGFNEKLMGRWKKSKPKLYKFLTSFTREEIERKLNGIKELGLIEH